MGAIAAAAGDMSGTAVSQAIGGVGGEVAGVIAGGMAAGAAAGVTQTLFYGGSAWGNVRNGAIGGAKSGFASAMFGQYAGAYVAGYWDGGADDARKALGNSLRNAFIAAGVKIAANSYDYVDSDVAATGRDESDALANNQCFEGDFTGMSVSDASAPVQLNPNVKSEGPRSSYGEMYNNLGDATAATALAVSFVVPVVGMMMTVAAGLLYMTAAIHGGEDKLSAAALFAAMGEGLSKGFGITGKPRAVFDLGMGTLGYIRDQKKEKP